MSKNKGGAPDKRLLEFKNALVPDYSQFRLSGQNK